MTSEVTLRISLVAAALAAVIVVIGLFGTGVRIACLAVMAIGAVVASPRRASDGGGWWWILAGGAAASIAGAIIAQPAATVGGVIALIGGLAVIIGAAIGFPTEE